MIRPSSKATARLAMARRFSPFATVFSYVTIADYVLIITYSRYIVLGVSPWANLKLPVQFNLDQSPLKDQKSSFLNIQKDTSVEIS